MRNSNSHGGEDDNITDSLSWATSCGLCLAPLPPPPAAPWTTPTTTEPMGATASTPSPSANTIFTTASGVLIVDLHHPEPSAGGAEKTLLQKELDREGGTDVTTQPGHTATTGSTTVCDNRLWSPLLLLTGMPADTTLAKVMQDTEGGPRASAGPTTMKCPICSDDTVLKVTNVAALMGSNATSIASGNCCQQQQQIAEAGADSCPLCDEEPATHSCSLCGSLVCEKPQCVRTITRLHTKMGHSFTPIEIKSAKTIIQCPEHNRPLELFCTQDNTPVCSLCVLSGCHQDTSLKAVHPTITISEAAKGRQLVITERSKELEEKVKVVKGSLLAITETISSVKKNCSEALKAMDEEFLRLETLLQKRHKQLAVECMNIADSTEKIMDIQHDHLEKFVFIAEAALKSASKVSHTSHDFGVIRFT
ncbi:hypothetical protein Pelo_18530 [Pelomyxa schiedti]|nr:hypothetical protein Pelo_18530 [Pelomyxa schiedti]